MKFFRKLLSRNYKKISVSELKELLNSKQKVILLDVRTEEEFECFHIENSINISVQDLSDNLHKLKKHKNDNIIVYCGSGVRSKVATQLLIVNGFSKVYDLGLISKFDDI